MFNCYPRNTLYSANKWHSIYKNIHTSQYTSLGLLKNYTLTIAYNEQPLNHRKRDCSDSESDHEEEFYYKEVEVGCDWLNLYNRNI